MAEAEASPKPTSTPAGAVDHRSRLRQRFVEGGADALPDYELLELLLFLAIPRRDVKPLAKALIAEFGDFAGVISQPVAKLTAVSGVGETTAVAMKVVHESAKRLARQQVLDRPVFSSWQAIVDYCIIAMARETVEQTRVLFLDRKNRLIADELQHRGTIDETALYPREIMKRALELGAGALVLVHNHPSGDPTPSRADISMTKQVIRAGEPFSIVVHDHLIVSRSGTTSFKSQGLI